MCFNLTELGRGCEYATDMKIKGIKEQSPDDVNVLTEAESKKDIRSSRRLRGARLCTNSTSSARTAPQKEDLPVEGRYLYEFSKEE